MAKSRKCGEAAFLYLTHSAVVSHFETALSLRPRGACRESRERPPPKQGVKGTLRRFAPLTALGRSEGMTVYEGKGGERISQ